MINPSNKTKVSDRMTVEKHLPHPFSRSPWAISQYSPLQVLQGIFAQKHFYRSTDTNARKPYSYDRQNYMSRFRQRSLFRPVGKQLVRKYSLVPMHQGFSKIIEDNVRESSLIEEEKFFKARWLIIHKKHDVGYQ